MEEAITFVMGFYNIDRQTAVSFYWDEVEAYMELLAKKDSGVV